MHVLSDAYMYVGMYAYMHVNDVYVRMAYVCVMYTHMMCVCVQTQTCAHTYMCK